MSKLRAGQGQLFACWFGGTSLSVKVLLGPGWVFARAISLLSGLQRICGKASIAVMCQGCSETGNTHLKVSM